MSTGYGWELRTTNWRIMWKVVHFSCQRDKSKLGMLGPTHGKRWFLKQTSTQSIFFHHGDCWFKKKTGDQPRRQDLRNIGLEERLQLHAQHVAAVVAQDPSQSHFTDRVELFYGGNINRRSLIEGGWSELAFELNDEPRVNEDGWPPSS